MYEVEAKKPTMRLLRRDSTYCSLRSNSRPLGDACHRYLDEYVGHIEVK